MSISDVGMLFQFIGGLGMFLYGMGEMADGLQRSAGHRMQRLLGVLTNNRLLGVLVLSLIHICPVGGGRHLYYLHDPDSGAPGRASGRVAGAS